MIKFTRSNVRQMEDEMVEVLNKYGFQNVTFSGSGARFEPAECTFKITGTVAGVKSHKQDELERRAIADGVDVNAVGPKGEVLIEYHSRKPKYPYIYKTISGKRYKCTPFQARNLFPL